MTTIVTSPGFFSERSPNGRSKQRKSRSGDHSSVAPPDPFPNSEVKRARADGSTAKGRVRVGRRQFLTRIVVLTDFGAGFFVFRLETEPFTKIYSRSEI